MRPKLICQGAEAIIIKSDNLVIKDRIKKSYRLPELDEKIRKHQTKSEAKLLTKASKIINTSSKNLPHITNQKQLMKLAKKFGKKKMMRF